MSGTLRDNCQGRWRGILGSFGIDRHSLTGKHGPCPMCGGKDRFRFDDKDGRGTWICSQCGAGDGIALAMAHKGWDFKTAAQEIEGIVGLVQREQEPRATRSDNDLRAAMNSLWSNGLPLGPDDPVTRYLGNRNIRLADYPPSLRYVEKCRYQGDPSGWHPAMIAKVTAPDGIPTSIHRTYLDWSGKKIAHAEPRKMMPGQIAKGSAVRLSPIAKVLGVAEGIETALSASIIWHVGCWSCLNTTLLMQWQPPPEVEEVIVFADGDVNYAGHAAAYALAHRLIAKHHLKARVEVPADPGMDWNDVLMAERAEVA